MANLRVENPKTSDDYVRLLADQGVILPLRLSETEFGEIVDAEGEPICVVDVNGVRGTESVDLIAEWIVVAVNTCGGFRAERETDG